MADDALRAAEARAAALELELRHALISVEVQNAKAAMFDETAEALAASRAALTDAQLARDASSSEARALRRQAERADAAESSAARSASRTNARRRGGRGCVRAASRAGRVGRCNSAAAGARLVCQSCSPRALADVWRARACSRQVDDAGAVCQPGPLTPQWKVRMRCRLLCCFPQPHAASGLQEAHAYFRAVRASGEVSPRARALTALLVALNPADYTAWAWRYRCVAAAAAEEEAAAAETNAPGAAASSAGAWSGCSADESQRRAFLLCTVH